MWKATSTKIGSKRITFTTDSCLKIQRIGISNCLIHIYKKCFRNNKEIVNKKKRFNKELPIIFRCLSCMLIVLLGTNQINNKLNSLLDS